MAKGKRKKYPKLPNGYGSIKYLGKKRRNPYAVHPPTEEFNENGVPITPKALCYVEDWTVGFAVLTAYKAGTYYPGMEQEIKPVTDSDNMDTNVLIERILADYNRSKGVEIDIHEKTFEEVYEEFCEYKFERDKSKNYSKSARYSIQAAFKNCSELHNKPFRALRHDDLQTVIDDCPLGYASLELIINLFNQMYAYAEIYELCDKNCSRYIKINVPDDTEHGEAFTENDLKKLWKNKDNEIIEFILIMCYSGYRISAYKTLKVNLHEQYFQGGIKTASGKNRIVPIHSAIYPLVDQRMKRLGKLLPESPNQYRANMYDALYELGIRKHTPHDCRHTFSSLCEKYSVRENDRKRLLGHSFKNDITNKIYGHREIEDLRTEIEKIKVCY